MLWALPPLLLLAVLDALAAPAPAPTPPAYPVSAARRGDRGFGFTHADDELYSGTLLVNGVPYQVGRSPRACSCALG